jgi:hypothetical protein
LGKYGNSLEWYIVEEITLAQHFKNPYKLDEMEQDYIDDLPGRRYNLAEYTHSGNRGGSISAKGKANISAAIRKRYENKAARKKTAVAVREAFKDPEKKQNLVTALYKTWDDVGRRERQRNIQSCRWANLDERLIQSKRMRKVLKRPDIRANHLAGLQRIHNDPAYRARHKAALNRPEVRSANRIRQVKFDEPALLKLHREYNKMSCTNSEAFHSLAYKYNVSYSTIRNAVLGKGNYTLEKRTVA